MMLSLIRAFLSGPKGGWNRASSLSDNLLTTPHHTTPHHTTTHTTPHHTTHHTTPHHTTHHTTPHHTTPHHTTPHHTTPHHTHHTTPHHTTLHHTTPHVSMYSELPLIWTPEMRPPLYSGHLESTSQIFAFVYISIQSKPLKCGHLTNQATFSGPEVAGIEGVHCTTKSGPKRGGQGLL